MPTVEESGFPGYETVAWFGLLVQPGVPAEIVTRLHAEAVKTCADQEIQKKLAVPGGDVVCYTPAEFRAFLAADIARWKEVATAAKIARDPKWDRPSHWPKLQALRKRGESDPAVVFAIALESGGTPAGIGFSWAEIGNAVEAITTLNPSVCPLDLATHRNAVRLAGRHKFGCRDALILASSLRAGCTVPQRRPAARPRNRGTAP